MSLLPGRLLTDEQLLSGLQSGQAYFELYYAFDQDTSVVTVSTEADLTRAKEKANQLASLDHLWLLVPRLGGTWTDAVAMPTSPADWARIQELYVALWASEDLPS